MTAMKSARFALPSIEHYVKSVRLWSFSDLYFPHLGVMPENTEQKNFEYGHFLPIGIQCFFVNLDITSSVT